MIAILAPFLAYGIESRGLFFVVVEVEEEESDVLDETEAGTGETAEVSGAGTGATEADETDFAVVVEVEAFVEEADELEDEVFLLEGSLLEETLLEDDLLEAVLFCFLEEDVC